MRLINARYVREDIIGELLQRMKDAIDEVESEHEYITMDEIIIAGSKIGFYKLKEEEKEV